MARDFRVNPKVKGHISLGEIQKLGMSHSQTQEYSVIFAIVCICDVWFSITSSAGFVEWSQMLSWSISWDEITQANSGQRDKTVVHRVQITPLVFKACKNSRRNQKQGNQYGQKYLEKIDSMHKIKGNVGTKQ